MASAAALAQTPGAVSVVFEAPPDCGSQSEFEARVRGRTRTRTLEPTAATDSRPSRFEVSLRRDEERVLGSLTIYETSGDANTREIEAASCSEAIDGLALIAALTLDPTSNLKAEPTEPAEPTPPTSGEPTQPPPTTDERAETRPSTPPELDEQPSERRPIRAALDGSVSVLATTGVSPESGLGLEPALGLFTDALVRSGSLLRVGGRIVRSHDVALAEGDATLEWRALMAQLCPALLPLHESLWITGCVAAEVGELAGQGRDTQNPRTRTSTWGALGPALLARWEVLSPLFVQVGGEALFPLNRDRFLLADATVYEIPPVSARGQGGLGVTFW